MFIQTKQGMFQSMYFCSVTCMSKLDFKAFIWCIIFYCSSMYQCIFICWEIWLSYTTHQHLFYSLIAIWMQCTSFPMTRNMLQSVDFHCFILFILTENMMWLWQTVRKSNCLADWVLCENSFNSIHFATLLRCHYWELVQYKTGLLVIIFLSHILCRSLMHNTSDI